MKRSAELTHSPAQEVPIAGEIALLAYWSKLTGRKLEMRGDGVNGKPFLPISGDLLDRTYRAQVAEDLARAWAGARKVGEPEITAAQFLRALEALASSLMQIHDQPAAEKGDAGAGGGGGEEADFLDAAPASVSRPLCLVDGRAYATVWPFAAGGDRIRVVIRDDGAAFGDASSPGLQPLGALGLRVVLGVEMYPGDGRGWSGAGAHRFMAGERPEPADVYSRALAVADTFLDFHRSLAPQATMCDLIACYVLATYLLDAYSVFGYLWVTGQMGSGKTNVLIVVAEMGYLGRLILHGGSYATLRDEADWGACLAFDEAEQVQNAKHADPDKVALMLAGNRRGVTIPFKEPLGSRGWCTRHVRAYCPRQFSAIKKPSGALASRSIVIPMVRSTKPAAEQPGDPTDHALWPCERRRLIDDLWAMGLTAMAAMPAYDARVGREAGLIGRDLEPWRALLSVALWLQEAHGVAGLFDRLRDLSHAYQGERAALEYENTTRLHVVALLELAKQRGWPAVLRFATGDLAGVVNSLAVQDELIAPGEAYTDNQRTGSLLKSLRLEKHNMGVAKGWQIARADLEAMARSYSIGGTPGKPSQGSQPSLARDDLAAASDGCDGPDGNDGLPGTPQHDDLLEGEI